jgi:hypothetical protein
LPCELAATGHVVHIVDSVIIPLANLHGQQRVDIARGKLHLHFENCRCHAAGHVQKEMAGHWWARLPHPRYSPDFATADNYLFGPLKQQLSRKTLDSEQNALETATEILSGLPKDELKNVFLHWKKRCVWVADRNGGSCPRNDPFILKFVRG